MLASEHRVVRNGLRSLIECDPAMTVSGAFGTGHEMLRALVEVVPDVAVLDPDLPDMDGLRLTEAITRRYPSVKLLVLSRRLDGAHVAQALMAGARGYVTKDSGGLEVRQAIRCLLHGGRYLNAAAALALLDELPRGTPWTQAATVFANLSLRERQVMIELVAGANDALVADRLALSPHAISAYRSRVMRKLNVQDDADLLQLAAQHGITSAA